MTEPASRITKLDLDERSIVRWNEQIANERDRAIADLLRDNYFRLRDGFHGPYQVRLSQRGGTLIASVNGPNPTDRVELSWPMRSLRRIIKDYFLICENYFSAVKGATANHIETVDMARRGVHNEGAEMLTEVIGGRVDVDDVTARRLFTLVCVLHLRS